jgi:hypothetical protein
MVGLSSTRESRARVKKRRIAGTTKKTGRIRVNDFMIVDYRTRFSDMAIWSDTTHLVLIFLPSDI